MDFPNSFCPFILSVPLFSEAADLQTAWIERVVDGDPLLLTNGERVCRPTSGTRHILRIHRLSLPTTDPASMLGVLLTIVGICHASLIRDLEAKKQLAVAGMAAVVTIISNQGGPRRYCD